MDDLGFGTFFGFAGEMNCMNVAIEHVDNYRLESVKESLSKGFSDLGFPSDNPLQDVVHPGDVVFIKPNWVASRWRASCSHKDSLYCVITHPAVIEAVADFVAIALKGRGKILIGDNPSIDADFEELMNFTGIRHIQDKYDVPCIIQDLRPLICTDLKYYGFRDRMQSQKGDILGGVKVNLGKESLLYGIDPALFRGVFNEREDTIKSHSGDMQMYTFAASLYNSDCYISIPKMKTHQKVGATLNLKGLVGSIIDKNQLVHWKVGYPEMGGDEYPNKQSFDYSKSATITHRGAWPGNDTIWRMVADLYQGLQKRKRSYFSVVDGIVAGEGQGPFCPTSKFADTLILGNDLLATDIVTSRYMGLNPQKIQYLRYFIEKGEVDFSSLSVTDNGVLQKNFFNKSSKYLDFIVPDQWKCIKSFQD